ncbi:MAG: cytochrome c oxidase subunit II [Planctomycetota bacterium]
MILPTSFPPRIEETPVLAHLIQDPAKAVNAIARAKPPELDEYGQLPKLASTFDHVDGLFYFTYAVCIFFFVLILGVLLFSVVKYRRRTFDQPAASNTTHNTPLEVVWTVIPLIIVMVMFAWGFKGCLDMTTVPQAASQNTYKATAAQWNWTFTYPNHPEKSRGAVWLEVNKPVQFLLESEDVLHAFYIPSMRVKRDVIPGRFQTVWFTPTQLGDFHLFCAEYCGDSHSLMYAQVHVVTAEEFAKAPWYTFDDSTPAKAAASGESIYKAQCSACHSVNGVGGAAPSWAGDKGLFRKDGDKVVGRERQVVEGGATKTVVADEAYIRESIRMPLAKLVADYATKANMSAFGPEKLSDRELNAVIEYMKTLAK